MGESMTVEFEVITGTDRSKVYAFDTPGVYGIGRSSDNETVAIPLPASDPYISRRHCEIEIGTSQLFIRSLGSVNPPLVNDVETTYGELRDGDVIQVGFTKLRVAIKPVKSTRDISGKHDVISENEKTGTSENTDTGVDSGDDATDKKSLASKYFNKMIAGIVWAVGGTIVTAVTYSAAVDNGGTYFIAWGAILYGCIDFVRGFYGWIANK